MTDVGSTNARVSTRLNPPPRTGRIGRPARLDRDMIARAAVEIGLDNVTMKAVAQQLGVSVPGLYHHVDGRGDLMRLATEYSAQVILLPGDSGQHWAEWLVEWAQCAFEAFVAQPEMLHRMQRGVFGIDRMADNIEAVLEKLTAQGFGEVEALRAFSLTTRIAVGAAVQALRQHDGGGDRLSEFQLAIEDRPDEELPYLRRLVTALDRDDTRPALEDEIATALVGIALRRGEPWEPILALVTLHEHRDLGRPRVV